MRASSAVHAARDHPSRLRPSTQPRRSRRELHVISLRIVRHFAPRVGDQGGGGSTEDAPALRRPGLYFSRKRCIAKGSRGHGRASGVARHLQHMLMLIKCVCSTALGLFSVLTQRRKNYSCGFGWRQCGRDDYAGSRRAAHGDQEDAAEAESPAQPTGRGTLGEAHIAVVALVDAERGRDHGRTGDALAGCCFPLPAHSHAGAVM